jgi:putative intracellular protease/amidase
LIAALASGKPIPRDRVHQRRRGCVGLREKAFWTVEDELVKLGVDFTRGEVWKPYIIVDRNLFTGQNPASAAPLAQEILKAL